MPAVGGEWQAHLGQATFTLLNPDHADHPTAWEGPLRMQISSSPPCECGLSLLTRLYGAKDSDYLIALTYSGSLQAIHFPELATCREKWPALKVFTEKIEVMEDSLLVHPACECPGGSAPCSCSAARIYRLSAIKPPEYLPAPSLALTRTILGVEFEGERKVLRPRSGTAELAKE